MKTWQDINMALAKLFELPHNTQRATILIRAGKPPLIKVTTVMIDDRRVKLTTSRFELREVTEDE